MQAKFSKNVVDRQFCKNTRGSTTFIYDENKLNTNQITMCIEYRM